MPTYKCLTGEKLTYPDPSPEIAAYLARAQAMAADPAVDIARMNQLVYSDENPLLDLSTGRPVVTRAVFDNPIYRVIRDLVGVKEQNLGLVDLVAEAAEYTVSLAEAAERLGLKPGTVRAAIAARKLDGWKRNGQWYVHPDSLARYKPSNRGRHNARPKTDASVRAKVGGAPGASLSVRLTDGELVKDSDGYRFPPAWGKAIVRTVAATAKGKTVKVYEIEPGKTPASIRVGDRIVEGAFTIVKRITNQREANDAWKAGV